MRRRLATTVSACLLAGACRGDTAAASASGDETGTETASTDESESSGETASTGESESSGETDAGQDLPDDPVQCTPASAFDLVPAQELEIGAFARALSLVDLDGDQALDIVATADGEARVIVLRGAGDGTFDEPVSLPLAHVGGPLVVGDVDGDTAPDLVTWGEGEMSVLRGTGDGGFEDPLVTAADASIHGIAGSFDGDDALDLALTAGEPWRVSLRAGAGDGSFGAPLELGPGVLLTRGDFDADGRVDLAAGESGVGVHVYLNDGDGFHAPVSHAAGPGPNLGAGDLDGDGRDDLLVVGGSLQLAVLLSLPDGSFAPALVHDDPLLFYAGGLELADFDCDGNLDAIVEAVQLVVFLGHGDGTFDAGIDVRVGSTPIAVGDVDQDGRVDVVVHSENAPLTALELRTNASQ